MGSKELSRIWEVLHAYREDCIPEGDEIYDEEWDDICYAMARIKETIDIDKKENSRSFKRSEKNRKGIQ